MFISYIYRHNAVYCRENSIIVYVNMENKSVKPFPTYNKFATDDFENVYSKLYKISLIVSINTAKYVENIAAKGEIARFEQFLFLSRCFQRSSAADASK